MPSPSKSERLKLLLGRGYFPEELPPPFNTLDFSKYRKSIHASWPQNQPKKSIYETYSIKRIGFKRRSLAITNPVSQYFLSKQIADDWVLLKSFLAEGKVSLDKALISKDGTRAIEKPDFGLVQAARVNASANDDFIFKSDISRFYDTIYTHAIAWVLEGKEWSKHNIGPNLNATLGGKLDILVRKGQDNQTQGIPTGPDTSRILSEIMAVGVEKRFLETSSISAENVYRYVDDWFIGIGSQAEGEDALQKLAQATHYYSLDLNIEKTEILLPSSTVFSLWPEQLKDCMSKSKKAKEQMNEITLFFATAFDLAMHNPSQNVLLFALKLSRSFPILKSNYAFFESLVYKVVRADNLTLPTAVQIIANYRYQHYSVSQKRASLLASDIISKSAPLGHTQEVAWSLFLLKVLGIKLSAAEANLVTTMNSSVCALLLLDLNEMGLVEDGVSLEPLASKMTPASLWDENWLLAYEAHKKGWLPGYGGVDHVAADPYFRVLRDKDVEFYDRKKNVEKFHVSLQRNITRARGRPSSSQVFAFLANLHGRYGDGP